MDASITKSLRGALRVQDDTPLELPRKATLTDDAVEISFQHRAPRTRPRGDTCLDTSNLAGSATKGGLANSKNAGAGWCCGLRVANGRATAACARRQQVPIANAWTDVFDTASYLGDHRIAAMFCCRPVAVAEYDSFDMSTRHDT